MVEIIEGSWRFWDRAWDGLSFVYRFVAKNTPVLIYHVYNPPQTDPFLSANQILSTKSRPPNLFHITRHAHFMPPSAGQAAGSAVKFASAAWWWAHGGCRCKG